jgi:hydrogenase maturation protease
MPPVTLLVCGEPMRGDDALALAVLEALPPTARARADVRHVRQLMPDDLHPHASPVIVLDAVAGPAPGTLVDVPLKGLAAASAGGDFHPASSHALPLPVTLGIVEQLSGGLPNGRFVGIGGADYTLGAGLSPAVRHAIAPCAARVSEWLTVLADQERTIACA